MNIQKINYTANNQPQFSARFTKGALSGVVSQIKNSNDITYQEGLTRLYTSLKYLDSILPGEKLKLDYGVKYISNGNWLSRGRSLQYAQVLAGNNEKLSYSENGLLDAIEKAFLKGGDNNLEIKSVKIRLKMPTGVYDNLWWNNMNLNVKHEDIEKFAFDVEA